MLYLECLNAIYGTLKAALQFYQKFLKDIENYRFKLNVYDWCVANKIVKGKQMTLIWHVDDIKVSHRDEAEIDKFLNYLREIYDDEEIGKMKVTKGDVHEFLGMRLDYSKKGKVIINMVDYVTKMCE